MNFLILNNWFKVKKIKFFSFSNSILLKKYFISYYNYKNSRKFFLNKNSLKRKINFRLRNFFFFFELRISNVFRKLGFKKINFISKNYESFILFNKFGKFKLYLKNKNYILSKYDLIILNYKYYKINKFYKYYYNSFFEVNYKIKSLIFLRFPFINEILKR